MPSVTPTFDIHCVTKWSKFDTTWTGVRVRDLFARAGVRPEATHVMEHAEFGYTTNIPLADITTDDAIVAYAYEGGPIEPTSTAARCGWSCRTSTSGSRPSGCARSS